MSARGTTGARRLAAGLAVLLLAGGCGRTRPLDGVLDLSGATRDPIGETTRRAAVLIFVRTDCPISNRLAPDIAELARTRGARDVDFWLVYSDNDRTPDEIRAHIQEYGLPPGALRDTRHALAARSGVQVTPEAVVFLPDGTLAYRGRIDDRFVDFGRAKAVARSHDLATALDEIIAGRPVTTPRTRAIGCPLGDLQ